MHVHVVNVQVHQLGPCTQEIVGPDLEMKIDAFAPGGAALPTRNVGRGTAIQNKTTGQYLKEEDRGTRVEKREPRVSGLQMSIPEAESRPRSRHDKHQR